MFQNIGEQDVVELPAVRKAKGFDIALMKGVVIGASVLCRRRIALDSSEMVTSFSQDLSQVAGGTADVENADRFSFLFQFFQDPIMAAVFKILKDVARLWFW
jgi:hypothetical protein